VPCKVAGIWLGETADRTLGIATGISVAFVMLGAVWLLLCLYPLHRSFIRNRWRIIVAFLAACWLTLAPMMFSLMAASSAASGRCQFNEGGVGGCTFFGVPSQAGRDLGAAFWGILIGYPLCLLLLIAYLVFLFIRWRRTSAASPATP